MSNDSYSGSQDYSGITPSRYNGAPPNTGSFTMQAQPAYAADPTTQPWQQQHTAHQNGISGRIASHPAMQQHQHQQPQQMVAAGGPMDVDASGAFFSGEVKRHLFW